MWIFRGLRHVHFDLVTAMSCTLTVHALNSSPSKVSVL